MPEVSHVSPSSSLHTRRALSARATRAATTLFVLILLVSTGLMAGPAPAAADVGLPAGFTPVRLATGHPAGNLTNVEFLPGDRILTLGRDGLVTVMSDDAPRTLTKIAGVTHTGDLGALGLALAPDYATTGHVYLLYAHTTSVGARFMRVARRTAAPVEDPMTFGSEHVILDVPLTSTYHAGGTVLVAPDGKLLVSLGDNATPLSYANPDSLRAQNVDTPYGKILRVDPVTGAGTSGNPFFSATSPSTWRSRTLAYGLRNPFRLSINPRNGQVMVGDVGWRDHEELDLLSPGANYGWPCYEGPVRQSGYASTPTCQRVYTQPVKAPVWTYPSPSQSSVTGGTWYTGASYPAQYQGAYFFADYSQQLIWTMAVDAQGKVTRAPEAAGFAANIGGPVALKTGMNGDVYFADILSSELVRLRYSPGNRAPIPRASVEVDPDTLTATFDGTASYDLDGDTVTHTWDFGDGQSGSGPVVSHTYATGSPVTATLRVTDASNGSGSLALSVVPSNHSPELALSAPEKKYAVGESVLLGATATDAEDGPLVVSWRTDLVHCATTGACHLHPGQTSQGPDFADAFDDHGDDTSMVVTASAVDAQGVRVEKTYLAEPDLRTLSLVAPAPVTINGSPLVTTKVAVNSVNVVSAPAQYLGRVFTGWSTGAVRNHELRMPAKDVILTAGYAPLVRGRFADYNGEGRTDHAVFRPSTTTWWDKGLFTASFGARDDVPVPADLTSDGLTDVVTWRPSDGIWRVRGHFQAQWGAPGDVPVPGDYVVAGRTDLAVWRPSTGVWWIRASTQIRWGVNGDVAVPGDYDGDGRLDVAVWRPSTGMWWIRGRTPIHWGQPGDIPVPADYNGDGRTDLAIWRPATGGWWIGNRLVQNWGVKGDVPLTGDFTGDGRTDLAVWRPSTGTWWVAGKPALRWGELGDKPLPRPLGAR